MASFMWIMMLLQRSQGTSKWKSKQKRDSDNEVTSEDEEEDNNSYDGNVITVTEAYNMAQHVWRCSDQ
jgi:hypothetical protein